MRNRGIPIVLALGFFLGSTSFMAGTFDLAEEQPLVTYLWARKVEVVGDFNGDGLTDMVLNTSRTGWRLSIVFGGELPSEPTVIDLQAEPADVRIRSKYSRTIFGIKSGDITNDGIDDLFLVATDQVVVLFGREDWPSTIDFNLPGDEPDMLLDNLQSGWYTSDLTVVDLNGDGSNDLALSSPGYECPGLAENEKGGGAVFLFWSKDENGNLPNRIDDLYETADASFCTTCSGGNLGGLECPQLGGALTAGDFNGDQIIDLAIGLPFNNFGSAHTGAVDIFYGRKESKPFPPRTDVAPMGGGDAILYGAGLEYHNPLSLAALDFDKDGLDDLAVFNDASYNPATGEFRETAGDLRVFTGGADFLSSGALSFLTDNGEWNLFGEDERDESRSVAFGDLNGDLYTDVILGAPGADRLSDPRLNAGRAHVILGRASQPGASFTRDLAYQQADMTILGANGTELEFLQGDALGFSVTLTDLDGDGIDEIVLGARGVLVEGQTRSVGAVYVLPDLGFEPQAP